MFLLPQIAALAVYGRNLHLVRRERRELERREHAYRAGMPPLDIAQKTAVLVDDGLATGSTMLAAVRAARQLGAAAVVCAAPVGSTEAAALVRAEADDVVLCQVPANLSSIGEWYEDFAQLDDAEVRRILSAARKDELLRQGSGPRSPPP